MTSGAADDRRDDRPPSARGATTAAPAATVVNGATAPYGDKPTILITNDDGLDPGAAMVLDLAGAMVRRGHRVVVCAPGKNNSACGQKITLGKELELRRHPGLEAEYGGPRRDMLHVYSLDDGSPADCVIVAIEPRTGVLARLGLRPVLTLSGVNVGPNLGPDILYSGTFGGARQAAMYGVPGVASSLAASGARREDARYARSCDLAVSGVAAVAETLLATLPATLPDAGRLAPLAARTAAEAAAAEADVAAAPGAAVRAAFAAGNVIVNLNVPAEWQGGYEACTLDGVLYRAVVRWADADAGADADADADADGTSKGGAGDGRRLAPLPTGERGRGAGRVTIGGGRVDAMEVAGSDALAVSRGRAAVSTLSTWPATHPLAVSAAVLEAGRAGGCGDKPRLPAWMLGQ